MPTFLHGLNHLRSALTDLGGRRVLLVTGPSARFRENIVSVLDGFAIRAFDGARRHVPVATVEAALAVLHEFAADTVVTLGGGSATGLGKALRLQSDVRFIAIPTTYSGSECTNLYGTTLPDGEGARKVTGRDDRVRPDVVICEPGLMLDMPLALTITSLMNASAHCVSALSREEASAERVQHAVRAFIRLYGSIETLVRAPRDRNARDEALAAAGDAAQLLEEGPLGLHHQLAHRLGGSHDVDHARVHSVLLPYSVSELRRQQPARLARLSSELGLWDLEGSLFDLLRRGRTAISLRELSLPEAGVERAFLDAGLPSDSAYRLAWDGRRPSASVRHADFGLEETQPMAGEELGGARLVVVALHGRASDAETILHRVQEMAPLASGLTIVAPRAPGGQWYAGAYSAGPLEREVDASIARVETVLECVAQQAPTAEVVLFGFSQGACLALEVLSRATRRIDRVIALSGARVVRPGGPLPISSTARGCHLLLGVAEGDGWVRSEDVDSAVREFAEAGCLVTNASVPGDEHRLHEYHRVLVARALTGLGGATQPGYGAVFESEALPDALPREQNSPRHTPYGLYPEQINGTGFAAPRARNLRSWFYRIRPSAQQSPLHLLEHPTFNTEFLQRPAEPNLCGWAPFPIPSAPTDFLDGIVTIGGAGDPALRRGYAVHWFALNRSMVDRAFSNADGDFLLVLQAGELTLLTESGVLDLSPGHVAVLPRGLRFSVLLRSRVARGFLGEIHGRHFELPERGPIGANGLADARHFRAPSAAFEDRLQLDYAIVSKLGGVLYQARQDYSPFDVAAWHGNYAPFSYDLRRFSPVSNVRIDHADPSIYTVLTSPLDDVGNNLLDFVLFPPRWDPTEHTFRPPYFHRNATMEFNGVLQNQALEGLHFEPGASFLTPPMTPHGVLSRGVERALRVDGGNERPLRHSDESLWFQFESSLPMQLSRAALEGDHRVPDWAMSWGAYRNHFGPRRA